MINLLSYEAKRQFRAARMNVVVLRYIFILSISTVFLAFACGVTYLFLANMTSSVKPTSSIVSSNPLQQAEILRTNLTTTKSILDQQVNYSAAVIGIDTMLPVGTVLDSVISNDGSASLKILAKSDGIEQTKSTLQGNFNKSPLLFSNYKFVSTSTTSNSDIVSQYPVTINVSVTINRGATQ